ncbi:MAG TPA: ferritin-like domain-containing protein [Thermoanaerobaculia bacterium]|jgi:ferritin-like metal-binding protein YciE|nr:ferritin-like domain-containing protein [Thermoanaerobaculia bacterium]
MKMESLKDLYLEQLRDLFDAETQLIDALPKMAEAAHHTDLKNAFNQHLRQTREHVTRLQRLFSALGERPEGQTCHGMKGLIKEGQEMVKAKGDPDVIDAGLIAAAQRVEHYEIAAYGTVRAYAEILGGEEAVKVLEKTLQEEEETDDKLTELAESQINVEAEVAMRR